MRIGFFIAYLLGICLATQAQDFSNKGKDFWLGYGNHVRMFRTPNTQNPAEQMQIYITSDVSTTGTVTIPGIGFTSAFTVTANQISTIDIPRTAGLFGEGKTNLGIHVTAEKPVVVYSFIYVGSISGATVCLPVATLGKEYYSVNYTQLSNESDSYSYFFAIATDTGTTSIEVTPSSNTRGGLVAGTTYTYNLTQGEVFQVLSASDLTGSKIKSVSSGAAGCKRIAVFCGSGKISIGCVNSVGTSDNLYQQMYPVNTWGKSYVTVPGINAADRTGQTNFYRIFTSDPSAAVSLNGTLVNGFVNGQYFDFNNNQTNYIQSDKPILVAQYFTSAGCSNNKGNGDPEMIYLNPTEQTISSVTLNSMQPNSGTNISEHYINAVVPNSPGAIGSFRIDGGQVGSFSPVAQNPAYAYTQVAVSRGAHTITCDSGFNAIAYGVGSAESYGYSAGTNLKDLYQFVTVNNQYAIVNFPAGCKNSPLSFSMTFPYQPTKINWVFGAGLNALGLRDSVINTPAYDSTWVVNGRTLYRYKLDKRYIINTTGSFPIKIFATNTTSDGCNGEQEINYDLQIYERPTVAFSYANNGCITDPVLFRDTVNGNGRPIIKYSWVFGDGLLADSSNPSHTYTSGGVYAVKFSAITDVGCLSDTLIKNVTVFTPPSAAFTPQAAACLNKAMLFTDNSQPAAGSTIVKWYWNFGDNSTPVVATNNSPVQHTYTATGIYNVTLQVELSSGCKSAVKTVPVTVHVLPVANFTAPAICLSDPVAQFTDSSYIADNSQASFTYLWDFGNGTTDTRKNGQGRYTATGIYDVKLTVTSRDGCVKDTTKKFTVNGAVPKALFSSVTDYTRLCSNKAIDIKDGSTIDFGKIIRTEIYWDYTGNPLIKTVDSFPASGKTYTWKYPDFGTPATKTVQIRYVVYSGINCVNEATSTVTLHASPQLQFDSMPPVCEEVPAFQLTAARDNSVFATLGVYSGKGVTASGMFNPLQAGAGVQLIKYSVTAANGCTADTSRAITVYPMPVVNAGPDKFLLEGGFVVLEGSATGNNPVYSWTPATFLDNTFVARPKVTSMQDIGYTLQVSTANGCKGTDEVLVKILKQIKVPNAFSPNGDGINDTWLIQYLDSYPDCTVDVYNRYGQVVFHSTGYTKSWDGRVNGQPLPVGTYYWIIDPKNGRTRINGSVTILR